MDWKTILENALNELEKDIAVEPWKRQPNLLKEAENRTGVPESTVYQWLKGRCSPKTETFLKFLDGMGYEIVNKESKTS